MRRGDINLKKMLKRKSKGFTLVELLIVVIIIGILAGMMMLSTGSATAKAEATKIVSDMRNIKAAAIMYYADNSAWTGDIKSLDKYVDASITADPYVAGQASITIESDEIQATVTDSDIQKALKKISAVTASGDTIYTMSIK